MRKVNRTLHVPRMLHIRRMPYIRRMLYIRLLLLLLGLFSGCGKPSPMTNTASLTPSAPPFTSSPTDTRSPSSTAPLTPLPSTPTPLPTQAPPRSLSVLGHSLLPTQGQTTTLTLSGPLTPSGRTQHTLPHAMVTPTSALPTYTPLPTLTPTIPPTPTPLPTSTSSPTTMPTPTPAPVIPPGSGNAVLANYFPWYDPGTWATGCTSAGDQPRDGPYNSDDENVIARHIRQAQTAGLDGFAVHWFAPDNRTDHNFNKVLHQAPGNFYTTVTFLYHILPGVDRQGVINALTYLINTYSGHPQFFRVAGKPVIMFSDMYRVPGSGSDHQTAIALWSEIRQAVDPGHNTWWIAEGLEPGYLATFDGIYVYKIAHACCPYAFQSAAKWAGWAQSWEQQTGMPKLWVGTVMPGWNDTNSANPQCADLRVSSDAFSVARGDGTYYAQTWQAVLGTHPDFVVLHSFNEWVEGSYIEPSINFGDRYLHLTAQHIAHYKNTP